MAVSSTFSFGKQEKLKSRKLIEQVFAEGKGISVPPLRLIYIKTTIETDAPVKLGVTASSRNFKKATDRNRIKRLLREAYRLNKTGLIAHATSTHQQFAVFIIYTDRSLPTFDLINQKMPIILNKLIKATSEASPKNS